MKAFLGALLLPVAGWAVPVEIAPDGAWTFFNDERGLFHEGHFYIGYVKRDGDVGLTRYTPPSGEAHHMVLGSDAARQRDDHNNPSLTVMPDGKLLAMYARHIADPFFFHRRSKVDAPKSIEDWGEEKRETVAAKVTYSNTFYLSGENRVYDFQRSLNFNPAYTTSGDAGRSWAEVRPLVKTGGGAVRPYFHYTSDGSGRIDLTYTDGHPRNAKNSLYHLYYENGSLHRSDGSVVKDMDALPLDHDAGERGTMIYRYFEGETPESRDDGMPNGRAWIWDLEYDSEGKPVCVFQLQPHRGDDFDREISSFPDGRIRYYWARWTGNTWEVRFIAEAGRGMYRDEDDYAGGICLDPDDPAVVYLSSNARSPFDLHQETVPLGPGERYEIHRGRTTDGGKSFEWEPVTKDSSEDQLRPFVAKGHGWKRHVVWFAGDYKTYEDYRCRVMGVFE